MGIGNANPFRFRLLLQLLDFVVGGALPALNQCAGVGFILQNADDGGSRPLAILAVGIAVLGIGQAVIFLIGQWRENAQPVQLVGNPQGTGAFQPHLKNVLNNTGGIGVGDQQILVVLGLHVAVHREGSNEITVPALYIQGGTGLYGNVPAVGFVHDIFDRNRQVIAVVLLSCVDVVGDGDESHTISRKHFAEVTACFDVLSPQPGEVFDNDAVDFPIGDILHHLLEGWAVKDDAAVAVVHFVGHYLYVGAALNEILNELALVGYAVALTGAVICIRQTDVGSCFVLCHEMSLLFVPGKLMKRVISEMA